MSEQIKKTRNISLVGHGGSGKTTISETLLFNAKIITRLGKVEEGNTVMDFQAEEIDKNQSVNCAFCQYKHKKHIISLMDTPGDMNFFSATKTCMPAFDSTIIVIDGVSGPGAMTEEAVYSIRKHKMASIVFINKLDRERSNFQAALAEAKENLKTKLVTIQIPIGKESNFNGVIDIINEKAYIYDDNNKASEAEIPKEMITEVEQVKNEFIENIAELDDALLERYLEGEELSKEELQVAFKKGLQEAKFTPVLCGSAVKNIGTDKLSDFIIKYMPNPIERGAWEAIDEKGEKVLCEPKIDAPFSAFVFNTIIDPYSGKLSLFRVISGNLDGESEFINVNKDEKEKFTQLFEIVGKEQKSISSVYPGSIVAVAKLKSTTTGDTLVKDKKITIKSPSPMYPVISFAISPKSKGDEDKIFGSLKKLLEEDCSLKLVRDSDTNETILSGRGIVHIETTVNKLKRKFGVSVDVNPPKVAYKETIKKKVRVQGKHKKQSGGHGQYGDCWVEISPLKRGEGFEFANKIVGGAIPKQYIPAVEKGIVEAAEKGFLAGYSCVDFKAVLDDGTFHSVDSSEMAFKIAGALAFKKALAVANVVLLEPIMKVEIFASVNFTGDIMGDLNARRGRVLGMDTKDDLQIIKANVPMSEMLRYIPDLRSMTGGRGTFIMGFDYYDEVPAELSQKIINVSKKNEA